MKINKIGGALVLSLCFSMANPGSSYASNTTEYKIETNDINKTKDALRQLANFDKASSREVTAYLENTSKEDEHIILDTFGKEYELRLDLAQKIEGIKKTQDPVNQEIIPRSIDILNSTNLEKIKEEIASLNAILTKAKDGSDKSIDLEKSDLARIDEQTKDYLEKGILFAGGSLDNKGKLEAFADAIINSKEYSLAEKAYQDKYNEIIYDLINGKSDSKEAYDNLLDFVNTDNKLDFYLPVIKEEDISANKDFKSSNESDVDGQDEENIETVSIENPSQEADNTKDEQSSAFLTNEKTKEKYDVLTQDQQKELDLIDTDKNGQISDSELDASANFSKDLDTNSWVYPFTDKALNKENDQASDNQSPSSEPVTTSPSSDNNANDDLKPKTVTIDDKKTKSPEVADQETDKEENDLEEEKEDFNEAKAQPENTNAASIVKTGIQGLGIVVLVLVVAVVAYIFLKKNKKDLRK